MIEIVQMGLGVATLLGNYRRASDALCARALLIYNTPALLLYSTTYYLRQH